MSGPPPPLYPRPRDSTFNLLQRKPPPPPVQNLTNAFSSCLFPPGIIRRKAQPIAIYQPVKGTRLADAWQTVLGEEPCVCEGCYKSFVLPLGLADDFKQMENIEAALNGVAWQCDFSHPPLKPYWDQVQKTRSLAPIIDYLSSLDLPACPSEDTSGTRYQLIPSVVDIAGGPCTICERCYFALVQATAFDAYFIKSSQKGTPCSLSFAHFTNRLAYGIATDLGDFAHFLDVHKSFAHYCLPASPKCQGLESAVLPSTYYTIPSIPGFFSCEVCCETTIRCFPHIKALAQGNQIPDGTQGYFTCHLTSLSPARFGELIQELLRSYAFENPTLFLSFASKLASTPRCAGAHQVANRRWHTGTSGALSECVACEDCYRQILSPSSLSRHFTPTPRLFPGNMVCDLFSQRMRAIYLDACAKNDLSTFTTTLNERQQAYIEWMTLQTQYEKEVSALEGSIRFMGQMGYYNPLNSSGIGDRTRPGSTMHLAIASQLRLEAGRQAQQEGSLFRRTVAAENRWKALQ